MTTFVVGQDSNTGGALAGPVGRAPVDLVSTWITSPGDMNAAYGSGYLLNATTAAQVAALYALGMQQVLVVDLSMYPLYALNPSGSLAADLANVVANFAGGGPPFTNLYVVLHAGIEAYNAGSTQAYLTAPLGGSNAPTVGGSTGAWTLTVSYQSSGGAAFPGCPVVQSGDTIYLDEVVGITGLDLTYSPSVPVDLAGPYTVTGTPTTTGGVTTFTLAIGAIQPVVLNTSTTDPTGPGPSFGGRLKIDRAQAIAHAGHTSDYQTVLAATLASVRTAIVGAYGRAAVGIGFTGMNWSAGSVGIGSSAWATAAAGMDFAAASLVGDYTQESTMVTALANAAGELATAFGKPFMVSWLDITEPAGTIVVHNSTHYSNLATAFTNFLNSVFTDTTMTTLTGAGLFAVNFYNDDYLNTQDTGTSYGDLVTKTDRYAQPQHFYGVATQPATAHIVLHPTPTLPAGARIQTGGTAPVQPVGARIRRIITPAGQPATASIIDTPVAFMAAIARITASASSSPQPAGARIQQPGTGPGQPATARLIVARLPTQPATAIIQASPAATQPSSATIGVYIPAGKNQPATARLRAPATSPQPAGAQVSNIAGAAISAGAVIFAETGYEGLIEPIDVTFTAPPRAPFFTVYPVDTGGPVPDPMCIPDSYEMILTEDLVLPFDPVPLLADGQTAVFPSSTLLNQDTQTDVTLANNPTTATLPNGTPVIIQRVIGGTDVATAGRYRLEVTFTAYPSSNKFTIPLDLVVVR